MSRIPDSIRHGRTSYLFATSKGLQKAAYYGFRAILVLFLIDQMGFERNQALYWYGIFTGAYMGLQLFASVISDLIRENRKVMLYGGVIQVIGFVLIGLIEESWMVGIPLVALGGAMFEDNQTSFFGRLYKEKKPLLDAGFATLITMVNIGAMLGILVLGILGEEGGYQLSFLLAAVIMSCAVYIMYRYENSGKVNLRNTESDLLDDGLIGLDYVDSNYTGSKFSWTWAFGLIIAILFTFFTIPLSEDVFALQVSIEDYSNPMLSSIGSYLAMLFCAILAVIWSYRFSSQYFKMTIAVTIFLFFYIFIKNSDLLLGGSDGLVLFIGFTALYELSFAFIAPVVYSLITEHINPRYYATGYAFSRIPERLLSYLGLGYVALQGLDQRIGIAILTVLGLCACVLQFARYRST